MGMFDDVIFLNNAPQCPEGHEIANLQSKDLDCDMSHYYVYNKVLYRSARNYYNQERQFEEVDGVLTLKDVYHAPRCDHTGEIFVYSFCGKCRPILFLNPKETGGYFGDMVQERLPNHEFRLFFEHGKLTKMVSECQTREEVRARLIKDELMRDLLLDDTDKLAIRHFAAKDKEQAEQTKKRGR